MIYFVSLRIEWTHNKIFMIGLADGMGWRAYYGILIPTFGNMRCLARFSTSRLRIGPLISKKSARSGRG